ncbi:MAG TPA: hypothetical protein VKA37_07280, partial [Halobacteriales archaeon]|nr:hypothetical protein [Halobacteriales archaeon]
RMLDEALVRPGRFEKAVAVDLPDQAARRDILDIHTRGRPLATDVDLDAIAREADGYSGADLEAVCREASFAAVGEVVEAASESAAGAVGQAHFLEALDAVEPSVDQPGAGTEGDGEGHAPMFS